MRTKTILFLGLSLVALAHPPSSSAQSMIRTTGDNTGISFAEETRGARPINGNIRGISFFQWVYGMQETGSSGLSSRSKWRPVLTYEPSYYRDPARILSTDNRGQVLKLRSSEGIWVAD